MPQAHLNPPKQCDICKNPIESVFYDAKTRMGPWANMCPECWEVYGLARLGTGFGQRYERQGDVFVKARG